MAKRQLTPERDLLAAKIGVLIDYLRRNGYRQKRWSLDINMPITAISRSQNSKTLRVREAEQVLRLTCEKFRLDIVPLHDNFTVQLREAKIPALDESKTLQSNWLHYFAGVYIGYIVRVREHTISTLFLLRQPTGKLIVRVETSEANQINRSIEGRWSLVNKNRIILDELDWQPEDNEFRVRQYMEALFHHGDMLIGTYSGFGYRNLKPIGGAVQFKKINDWIGTTEQMLSVFNDKTAKDKSLASHDDTTRVLKADPQLLDFFMGNNDYDLRIENSQLFRNVGLLPLAPNNVEMIAGCYYSYRLAVSRQAVYGNPFIIYSDGRVHMKRSDLSGDYEEYRGFATLDNGFLSVHIDRKVGRYGAKPEPLALHFMYNWGNFHRYELKYAFGTATMLTMNKTLRAAEEVLLPLINDDLKQLSPRAITVDTLVDCSLMEQQIVAYLQKSPVCLSEKMPNSHF